MKLQYERTLLNVTRFGDNDVIVTSEFDRNNAYQDLGDMDSGRDIRPIR